MENNIITPTGNVFTEKHVYSGSLSDMIARPFSAGLLWDGYRPYHYVDIIGILDYPGVWFFGCVVLWIYFDE